jgi:hypothetical protein
MNHVEKISHLCSLGAFRWTDHILDRITKRNISREEVKFVVESGEIIEDYPDDYPYPSCLVLGFSDDNPIHVVCGVSDDELWMITAYYPDEDEWLDDNKTRRENV